MGVEDRWVFASRDQLADDFRVGVEHVVDAGANFQMFTKLPGTTEIEIANVWNCGVQLVKDSVG